MIEKCHVKTLRHALFRIALVICFLGTDVVYSQQLPNKKIAQRANDKTAPVSLEELDTQVEKEAPKDADETEKAPEEEQPLKKAPPKSPLPDVNQLVEAKISALKASLLKQEEALAKVEKKLLAEQGMEGKAFDTDAFFSLSIENNAPPAEYELLDTSIYVDDRRIARGGKNNDGLPRGEEIFFGPVEPGCHDITVKARYRRLKRDLIVKFKVNEIEIITRSQSFVAKSGYRVLITIEGYEQQNSLINWYRGPNFRFNRSVRPNFLPGSPIVSMDDVLKQGRVRIDYEAQDGSSYRLLEKSLSIDGLPVLNQEKHDEKQKTVVFDGPLAEGNHKLSSVLLFGEVPWVKGGPMYNFRLTFERDFFVIGGQSTLLNLHVPIDNGFRSSPYQTRQARVTSRILSEEHPEFFPKMSCRALADIEAKKLKKIAPKASGTEQPPFATPPVEETPPPLEGGQPEPLKAPVEENKPEPAPPPTEQKTDEVSTPVKESLLAPVENKTPSEVNGEN